MREAEAAFRQAISLYDLSPESNYRLAELLSREGRFDEAREIFEVFLEKDPNNEQANLVRNQITLRQSAGQQVDAGCGQLRARVIALRAA